MTPLSTTTVAKHTVGKGSVSAQHLMSAGRAARLLARIPLLRGSGQNLLGTSFCWGEVRTL